MTRCNMPENCEKNPTKNEFQTHNITWSNNEGVDFQYQLKVLNVLWSIWTRLQKIQGQS